MSIRYLPKDLTGKAIKQIEKLVTRNLTINRAVIGTIARSYNLPRRQVESLALKVLKSYRERFKEERELGKSKRESYSESVSDKRLLLSRVENTINHETAQAIKRNYRGEYYRWLPSSSTNPDPEHQLKYGKVFQIGKGEGPGDRYGCKCGMEILTDETKLTLED